MKLFITGATGFIGSHVVQQALAAGHEVVALRRPGSQPRIPLDKPPVWVDAPLDADLHEALKGCEALIHLASHTPNPPYAPLDECLYWNVFAAIRLARQAREAGITRYLVAGSCFEHGIAAEGLDLIEPDTPLQPNLSYPTSKAAATIAFEGFAREQQVRLKTLRIYQVYGEGEAEQRLWPALRRAARSGADFPMSAGEQVRDFIDVREVAARFLAHLDFDRCQPGAPEIHPIASGCPQTLLEFATYWWNTWEGAGRLLPGAVPYRHNELMRLVPRMTR
jgi:nucleoside-diphosphate-sugar epimerase